VYHGRQEHAPGCHIYVPHLFLLLIGIRLLRMQLPSCKLCTPNPRAHVRARTHTRQGSDGGTFFFCCSPRSALMRSSLGFSIRFTSANFRVFFAFPITLP